MDIESTLDNDTAHDAQRDLQQRLLLATPQHTTRGFLFSALLRVVRELGGDEAGLYVDPLDTAALAQAISWLLGHPEEAAEMGRRGRMRVESQFSWEAEGRKLLRLYDEVLGEARLQDQEASPRRT